MSLPESLLGPRCFSAWARARGPCGRGPGSRLTSKNRKSWGGPRPGAGRPKGSGRGSSPDARVHRVAIMVSLAERERLKSLAKTAGQPLATFAYELVLRGLRSIARRPRSS